MSKKLFIKSINYLSVFALVFFCGINFVFAKENSSVNVESRVNAMANSGRSVISGSGTIKTGDARASAKSITLVNGGENVKIVTQAQAQTSGKTGTASVEADGEKKSCSAEDGESCQVEISRTSEPVVCAQGDDCEVIVKSVEELADEEKAFQEEKKIEETIDLDDGEAGNGFGSAVQDFFSGIVGKIRSWF